MSKNAMRKLRTKKAAAAIAAVLLAALLTPPPVAAAVTGGQSEPASASFYPKSYDWSKLTDGDGVLLPKAVVADAAILMDASTGKVLFEKNSDDKHFPASITKIMTCLVAVTKMSSLSGRVTIGKLPSLESGAETIDLKQGEKFTLEQLLYALMLESANDAANAIAMNVGGSVDKFVGLMNDKAQELGMTGTHYMNTNGLDNPNHFTTARDMATLTRAALQTKAFSKIVSTVNYTMPATNKHTGTRLWTNHNLLIVKKSGNEFYYPNATGVKTGFTDTAQSTLVASAKKGNMQLIAVVLHDQKFPKWTDCVEMFEYGFEYFDSLNIAPVLGTGTVSVDIKNADLADPGQGKLDAELSPEEATAWVTDTKATIDSLKSDPSKFEKTVSVMLDKAPIKKGDVLGTATFTYAGAPVLVCDLKATRDVLAAPATTSPAPTPEASMTATEPDSATPSPDETTPAPTPKPTGIASVSSIVVYAFAGAMFLVAAAIVVLLIRRGRKPKKSAVPPAQVSRRGRSVSGRSRR